MKKVKSISLSIFLFVLLIVCICAFNIQASANVYSEYLNGKNLNSGLVYEPTLILDLKDLDELNNDSLNYVTSVIMALDEKCDVIVGEKNYEFSSFFNEYIKGKYVPIVNLNKDNYKAFIKYYKETYTIYDLMVMSSDLEVLGEIYSDSEMYILNSVYDYRGIILDSDRYSYWKLVSSCNKVGCNIIMANANDSNLSVLTEYAQAMTKVVWGYGTTLIDAINSVSSGCYGVSNTKTNNLVQGISYFNLTGWHHPQYIAAHRGITKYCNENSLTSALASYSEGATHIEVDLQVLADESIVLCHNSQTNYNSDKLGWYFIRVQLENLRNAKLNDYNINYDETYCTLEELFEAMLKTDIIMILELKFDNGSLEAVDELKCIENLKRICDSMPEVYGHFYCITFFAPCAEKMKELMPEIPLGYIGGARSTKEQLQGFMAWSKGGGHKEMYDYKGKIKFLRYYNIGLDESYVYANSSGEYYSNITASFYLARGYVQNTWTYEDTLNFKMKTNTATTNCANECAYLIKGFLDYDLVITKEEFDNRKCICKTYSYNGWVEEKECTIIVISQSGSDMAKVILYYYEDGSNPYGLYSSVKNIIIN